jgi:hypothetical protein
MEKKRYKLTNEDIVISSKEKASSIVRNTKSLGLSLAICATSIVVLPSCSDEKSCTDSDYGTQAPYDIGVNQDPTDYGGTTSLGDSSGNGDECRDYD